MPEIPIRSSAAFYGKGVFTTVGILAGRPFLWEKHWRRLVSDAHRIGLEMPGQSEESIFADLNKAIIEKGLDDGRSRVTFFDERLRGIWANASQGETIVDIVIDGPRPVTESFRLGVSKFRVNSRSPLAGVKSCNYLDKLMALNEAKERGFDEAVMLNERGEVASAVMANLFWLKGGRLFTPSLKTGCLSGTTREFVLENMECREIEAELDVLGEIEAIFLTSAGIGIAAAAEFDSKLLANEHHHILDLWPKAS